MAGKTADTDSGVAQQIKDAFSERMDGDLDVKGAFDNVVDLVSGIDLRHLAPSTASGIIKALRAIDEVLQVIF